MRRKLLIGGLSLLGLLLLLIIGILFYIRSGKLDVYLEGQVKDALADFGIRAEFGRAHIDLRGYQVTLENIKLYAGDGQKPFGEIDRLTAQFSVLSYLHQKLKITQVEIVHPHAWLEVDKQGRFNLASLHASPSKQEVKESSVTFLTSNFEIRDAEINLVDMKRDITAQMTNLGIHLVPLAPESIVDELNHRLEIGFTGATATVEGRKINDITANILAKVTEHDVEILAINGDPQFKITSDLGQLKLNGRVESFEPLKYELTGVHLDAALNQITRVFAPDLKMDGTIGFIGRVDGTGSDYHAN